MLNTLMGSKAVRLWAAITVVALLLSTLPAYFSTALAAGEVVRQSDGALFDTLQEAHDHASTTAGDTLTLTTNLTTTEQVTITKAITVDGDGFTVDADFVKTDNSNNSAIGVQGDGVTIKDIVLTSSGDMPWPEQLHGVNVYEATGITLEGVTAQDFEGSGLVVNGSTVSVSDMTTSNNGWHAINVAQGSGVTDPAVLNISESSDHGEVWPPVPHIYIDDISQDATVNDLDSQYSFTEFPNPNDGTKTARAYYLTPEASLEITDPASDGEEFPPVATVFSASYTDDDSTEDTIHWAVKPAACEAGNPGSNLLGFSTPGYTPADYSTSTGDIFIDADLSVLPLGDYCLVVNPLETGGETDTEREVRYFSVALPDASLTITDPEEDDEVLSGVHTFMAEYVDDDLEEDPIRWAIRSGTCEAGVSTVAGNVDGFSDPFDFTAPDFSATVDMTAWTPGEYCFIINPDEGDEDEDFRETRVFVVEEAPECIVNVNLLENPSFEEPVVTKKRNWDLVEPIAWLVKYVGGGATDIELQRGVFGWDASDGQQHTELGTDANVRISQDIVTIPGQEYTLSWDYSPRPNTEKPDSKMIVKVDGVKIDTLNRNGGSDVDWTSHTHTFEATDKLTRILFAARGDNNGRGALLDNTSLICGEPLPHYLIDGYKWNDENYNHEWDEWEDTLAGWTIEITNGEMTYSTTTDENGYYWFEVYGEDEWEVSEVQQPGWEQTAPYYTESVEDTDEGYEWYAGTCIFEVGVDEEPEDQDEESEYTNSYSCNFGNHYYYEMIDGYKWEDHNGNGYWDEWEDTLAGWTIEITNGSTTYSTTTDEYGYYWFKVEPGTWTVSEVQQEGWVQTAPMSYSFPTVAFCDSDECPEPEVEHIYTCTFEVEHEYPDDGPIDQDVLTITDVEWEESGYSCDFGNHWNREIIDGYKWNDENYNGYWDKEELELSGWTIEITNGSTTYSTTTDEYGYYWFEVDPGTWTVSEVQQEGWFQTAPADPGTCTHEVMGWEYYPLFSLVDSLTDEESEYGYDCDFGNYYEGIPEEDGPLSCSLTTDDPGIGNGESTNLIWDTNGALSVAIDNGIGSVSNDGTMSVSPVEDTTYTLTAAGSGFATTSCSVTINVGNNSSGSRTSDGGGSSPAGQVLGAATSAGQCGMYLLEYMKLGSADNAWEVMKLQVFLTSQGYFTPMTGTFDAVTDANVKLYQAAHSAEVMQPWVDAGLATDVTPTGYVFKTTRWHINNEVCPGSEAFPVL